MAKVVLGQMFGCYDPVTCEDFINSLSAAGLDLSDDDTHTTVTKLYQAADKYGISSTEGLSQDGMCL